MEFTIITLFPEMFEGVFGKSILGRAQKEGTIKINFVNLREFGEGRHLVVDDRPYGGGVGMILKVDVMDRAVQAAKKGTENEEVILLDPRGKTYSQETAEELSTRKHLIFISGHYEGYDERIRSFVDREISIGDYVLTGGEIPVMAIVDSVSRLVPGVLRKEEAHMYESFSKDNRKRVEHPQYTRPEEWNGMKVPEILLTGHHKKIAEYQEEESKRVSIHKR